VSEGEREEPAKKARKRDWRFCGDVMTCILVALPSLFEAVQNIDLIVMLT